MNRLYTPKKGCGSGIIIVILYVDDLVFTENITKMIKEFKNNMVNKYDMNDMKILTLGIERYQDENDIFIFQKNYMDKIDVKFNMF